MSRGTGSITSASVCHGSTFKCDGSMALNLKKLPPETPCYHDVSEVKQFMTEN